MEQKPTKKFNKYVMAIIIGAAVAGMIIAIYETFIKPEPFILAPTNEVPPPPAE